MAKKTYDLIIIGGGPGGYSAGIYAKRYDLNILIITKERGGLITKTDIIENYPGFKSISGIELMKKFEEHTKYYNIEIKDELVTDVIKEDDLFKIVTNNNEYYSKAVTFATGSKVRKLNVIGEEKFLGRGVSYCATCDGMFFKNKIVSVIGGSDSAVKEALMLSNICKEVYLIYRGEKLRAEPINLKRIINKDNIKILYNTEITEIGGNQVVEFVRLNKKYNNNEILNVNGVFIEIGHIPQSDLLVKLGVKVNDKKEVVVDKFMRTNIERVYAVGDVTDIDFKQVITSAFQGALSAKSAFEDLNK